jgi:ATP:ADP antiporter, AAA family
MFQAIKRALWGDISGEEFKRFGLLSLTFLFIIGTYWLMRPLKDGLFMDIVGGTWIPRAKMLSLVIIVPLILIYSKLVDLFPKQKLFYIICTFYSLLFIAIAFALQNPTIGLANKVPGADRMLGWIIYLSIESFGSLVVALFWSFVASTTDASSAKKGYAIIISGAQVGSIAGPFIGTKAETFGMFNLTLFVAIGIMIVPFLIKLFITVNPSAAEAKSTSTEKKTGIIEGLKLLLTRPYLAGILGVATLYEIIGTIIDYQMKLAAKAAFVTPEKVTSFLSSFGMAANSLALIFALIGTSFFIRKFGLTFCLVAFPVTIGLVVGCVWAFPGIWILFGAMVAIKGLSYALNNPCKEIMYIPTSKDTKFKAKGWIDMFGGRSAKAAGSGINDFFPVLSELMFYGSIISLGIVGIWIVVALYVGKTNKKLTESGTIIS